MYSTPCLAVVCEYSTLLTPAVTFLCLGTTACNRCAAWFGRTNRWRRTPTPTKVRVHIVDVLQCDQYTPLAHYLSIPINCCVPGARVLGDTFRGVLLGQYFNFSTTTFFGLHLYAFSKATWNVWRIGLLYWRVKLNPNVVNVVPPSNHPLLGLFHRPAGTVFDVSVSHAFQGQLYLGLLLDVPLLWTCRSRRTQRWQSVLLRTYVVSKSLSRRPCSFSYPFGPAPTYVLGQAQ